MMITRLPAGDLESYTKLKTFILAQHKLSSKDYKQRFSHAMRNSKETNVANNGGKSPFHKKPVAVNLTTVELPPIGDDGSFENPTVCRIDVAACHNSCNVTSAESYDSCESYDKSLEPDLVTTLETLWYLASDYI